MPKRSGPLPLTATLISESVYEPPCPYQIRSVRNASALPPQAAIVGKRFGVPVWSFATSLATIALQNLDQARCVGRQTRVARLSFATLTLALRTACTTQTLVIQSARS